MPKKADANQSLFTAAARACGLLVQPIHECGNGVPDLIVAGYHPAGTWKQLLVELKCNDWIIPPTDPRWINTLTKDEQAWHVEWRHAPVLITNRLRWVLAWFGWDDDDIRAGLAGLAQDKGVRVALRAVERRDGAVSSALMATIE